LTSRFIKASTATLFFYLQEEEEHDDKNRYDDDCPDLRGFRCHTNGPSSEGLRDRRDGDVPSALDEISKPVVVALLRAGHRRHGDRPFAHAAQLFEDIAGVRPRETGAAVTTTRAGRCRMSVESVPCKGQSPQPVEVRLKEVSVRLDSYPGDGRVTEPSKPRGQRPAFGTGQRGYGPQHA
jgi:hypothetical protein